MEIGTEISQKIRSAIKAKLIDLRTYVDEELPDYIMVMVANKKTPAQMNKDLSLFLAENTEKFTSWLHGLLERLKSISTESLSKKAAASNESSRDHDNDEGMNEHKGHHPRSDDTSPENTEHKKSKSHDKSEKSMRKRDAAKNDKLDTGSSTKKGKLMNASASLRKSSVKVGKGDKQTSERETRNNAEDDDDGKSVREGEKGKDSPTLSGSKSALLMVPPSVRARIKKHKDSIILPESRASDETRDMSLEEYDHAKQKQKTAKHAKQMDEDKMDVKRQESSSHKSSVPKTETKVKVEDKTVSNKRKLKQTNLKDQLEIEPSKKNKPLPENVIENTVKPESVSKSAVSYRDKASGQQDDRHKVKKEKGVREVCKSGIDGKQVIPDRGIQEIPKVKTEKSRHGISDNKTAKEHSRSALESRHEEHAMDTIRVKSAKRDTANEVSSHEKDVVKDGKEQKRGYKNESVTVAKHISKEQKHGNDSRSENEIVASVKPVKKADIDPELKDNKREYRDEPVKVIKNKAVDTSSNKKIKNTDHDASVNDASTSEAGDGEKHSVKSEHKGHGIMVSKTKPRDTGNKNKVIDRQVRSKLDKDIHSKKEEEETAMKEQEAEAPDKDIIPDLLEEEHDEFTEEFTQEEALTVSKKPKFVREDSLSSEREGTKITSAVKIAMPRRKEYVSSRDRYYGGNDRHRQRFTSPLRMSPKPRREGSRPDPYPRHRRYRDLDEPESSDDEDTRGSVSGNSRRRQTRTPDEEYDPYNPKVGNVASVIRVTERRKLPKSLQADKTLLLKAMSEANRSTETTKLYQATQVSAVQRDSDGRLQLFSRSKRLDLQRPLCVVKSSASQDNEAFAFTGMVSDSRQVRVTKKAPYHSQYLANPRPSLEATVDTYGGQERRVFEVESEVSDTSGSSVSAITSDSESEREGRWVEKTVETHAKAAESDRRRDHSARVCVDLPRILNVEKKGVSRVEQKNKKSSARCTNSGSALNQKVRPTRKPVQNDSVKMAADTEERKCGVGGGNKESLEGHEPPTHTMEDDTTKIGYVQVKVAETTDRMGDDGNSDDCGDKTSTQIDSEESEKEVDDDKLSITNEETSDDGEDRDSGGGESHSVKDRPQPAAISESRGGAEGGDRTESQADPSISTESKKNASSVSDDSGADYHDPESTNMSLDSDDRIVSRIADRNDTSPVATHRSSSHITASQHDPVIDECRGDTRHSVLSENLTEEYIPRYAKPPSTNDPITSPNYRNALIEQPPSGTDAPDEDTKFIVTLDFVNNKPPPLHVDPRPSLPVMPVRPKRQKIPTVAINLADSDGDSDADPTPPTEAPPVKTERCKFWPACVSGKSCLYHHPTTPCRSFPKCKFGDKCLYIHPNCKYDATCTRPECPFTHTKRPTSRAKITYIPVIQKPAISSVKASVICKFHPNCTNSACLFVHPKTCNFGSTCRAQPNCPFFHPPSVHSSHLKLSHV